MALFPTAATPSDADGFGLWMTCPHCGRTLRDRDEARRLHVCSSCGHHLRLGAAARLRTLLDHGRWTEHDASLASADPLAFTDQTPYPTRLQAGSAATGLRDAVIAATGTIGGLTIEAVAMEFGFIGGSLGLVAGEKIARAAERALARHRPLVVVCASSGARVMEGTLSLLQMAKVSASLGRLDRARVPYVTVLTDPTIGGVAASVAMLADVIIAEPGARLGFAGPQVIERRGERLPQGFQRSEYLLDHGMVDMVVDRRELSPTLARLLRFLGAAPAVEQSGPATAADAAVGANPPSLLDLPLD